MKNAHLLLAIFAWWFALYDPVDWPKGTVPIPSVWNGQGLFETLEACQYERSHFIKTFQLLPSQGVYRCMYWKGGFGSEPEMTDLGIRPKSNVPRKPSSGGT